MTGPVHLDETHQELGNASIKIGSIYQMPSWMVSGLAARVHSTGKTLDDITIGELNSIMHQQAKLHSHVEKEIVCFRPKQQR